LGFLVNYSAVEGLHGGDFVVFKRIHLVNYKTSNGIIYLYNATYTS